MSYDLAILIPEDADSPELKALPLDRALVAESISKLLEAENHKKYNANEYDWYLPTRTAIVSIDETEPPEWININLYWGDRSDTTFDASQAPPQQDSNPRIAKDLTSLFTKLVSLADQLGAKLYDYQDDLYITHDNLAQRVADFNHDDLVRQVHAEQLSKSASSQASTPKKRDNKMIYKIVAVVLVLSLIGLKAFNRYERKEARQEEWRQESTQQPYRASQPHRQQVKRTGIPSAEIWLDQNQVLHRTALKNAEGTRMLTWVIQVNGRTVLERNAENEMQYTVNRLVSGAVLTAYLKAHFDGKYHTVSNVVTYQAP